MDTNQVIDILEHSGRAVEWFRTLGLQAPQEASQDLRLIAEAGIPTDLMAVICSLLEEQLLQLEHADLAVSTLRRFVQATRNPLSFGVLIEQEPESLYGLLQIFSCSQHFGHLLVKDPEAYDLLRMTEGQPSSRQALVDEITAEIRNLRERHSALSALRRYHGRETLRIAYGDIVQGHPLQVVMQQLTWLADAICEGALLFASRDLEQRFGKPLRPDGEVSRFAVLGLGLLGANELDYSSDIRLIFLYESEGTTDAAQTIGNADYFEKLAAEFLKLMTDPADLTAGYQVDVSLRPTGPSGALAISRKAAAHHYDIKGRTWERQAFVKARPVAGDANLGDNFYQDLQPWIFRRYLNRADITGIKALKRRIGKRDEDEDSTVWSGAGGTRDIETVIQFLQLLNGGDLPEIRTGNTLEAIDRLHDHLCLTTEERNVLAENYEALRKIEHLSQMMFDAKAKSIPTDDDRLRKLALRAGYLGSNAQLISALRTDLAERMTTTRQILNNLLNESFGKDDNTDPAVDLLLDPEPTAQGICDVLMSYGFMQLDDAYQNLNSLADEQIPFLSTRRCRHFLASIVPALLAAIAKTPDPDATLARLRHVSDSIGGKGVLWESFRTSAPSLNLYVRLCAACPYLARILTSHPGMIDELMDSLMLGELPSIESLQSLLNDLCRNADDLSVVLHSFKNTQHLNVGVRDILGKDDIRSTTRALADIGEVCLKKVLRREYDDLVARYGIPSREEEDGAVGERPVELVVIALGKLGGQEPNYHSFLDIMLLYDADGNTSVPQSSRRAHSTTNQHFFSELAQHTIKLFNHLGPQGKLYDLDVKLRARGHVGALAMSFASFRAFYHSNKCPLACRQALCKARPIYGSDRACAEATELIRQAITADAWRAEDSAELKETRITLEKTAATQNLKRGFGGTIDVEFAVQALQLRFAADHPSILVPGTLDAIKQLHEAQLIDQQDADSLADSYRFLRSVEARLRLMNTSARHDLPQDQRTLESLAYLLQMTVDDLQSQCDRSTRNNRELFERTLRQTQKPVSRR